MMSIGSIIRYENCNHDIEKYLNGDFVKDDYCDFCLDQIEEIDQDYKDSTQ